MQLTQLGELLDAQSDLLAALSHLSQAANDDATLLSWARLHAIVAEGQPLSRALTECGLGHIAPMAPALVAIGEETGELATILLGIAAALEREQSLKQRIMAPMRYPVLVLCLSLVLMLAMLKFIVPAFATLYGSQTAALALPTRMMFALSGHLEAPSIAGYLMVPLGMSLVAIGWRYRLHYRQALPVLGPLWRSSNRITLLATLALALHHHLPLNRCLQLLESREDSRRRKALPLAGIKQQLDAGVPLATALGNAQVLDAMLLGIITTGEQSGRLPSALERAAEYESKRLERRLQRLESWLEPMLMLGMAGLLGAAVIALYLPVFEIGNQL